MRFLVTAGRMALAAALTLAVAHAQVVSRYAAPAPKGSIHVVFAGAQIYNCLYPDPGYKANSTHTVKLSMQDAGYTLTDLPVQAYNRVHDIVTGPATTPGGTPPTVSEAYILVAYPVPFGTACPTLVFPTDPAK